MKLYISAVCVAVAFVSGWVVNGWRLNSSLAELKKKHTEELLTAQIRAKVETEKRVREAGRIANEAKLEKEKALTDAVNARNVSKRLHEQLQDRTRSDCSAIVNGSTATDTSGDLCSVMFSRLDESAGRIALYADRARIAGDACKKQYESLSNATQKSR